MNNPDISVVIPTLGRTDVLEKCLNSLSIQTFLNFEIIIVTDKKNRLEYLTDKFKNLNISIIEQTAKGLASARNSGLFNSKGGIISFIDDDVITNNEWLREIFSTFKKRLNTGGVSGPTIIPQELSANRDILAFHEKTKANIIWRIIGKAYNYFVLENRPYSIGKIFKSGGFSLGSNYIEATQIDKEIEVDYLEACNMSFRKDILNKIGGFSIEYKGIGDWSEPDLAFRVGKEGYKLIFNPRAAVKHMVSQSGVYIDRGRDSCQRMKNFMHFYYKWIRPDTINKTVRFGINLLFLNSYWLYKFVLTGKLSWLSGIKGTLCGLEREACKS